VLLSVGIKSPNEFDKNASEAEIRDSCLEEARSNLARFSSKAEWFKVTKSGSDAVVAQWDGNHSLPVMDFEDISLRTGMLKIGRSQDGGYLAIVGGIINKMGEVERHGRWLPHPILVPMMVGTAMSLEKEYYSADATFEIGRLSQKALSGDLPAKERIRSFYWAAHQLARKMNLMQMAELTQSCPDLQGVFDLAALIRMRNRPLSESIGRIKSAERELGFLPLGERESAVKKLKFLIDEKKVAQNDFERELQVIYAGTLLSGDPDGIYRFVKSYPVYVRDGDEDAAVAALRDLKIAMSYGQGSVQHLLKLNKPIHDEGPFESLVAPVFPLLGGDLLTHLSHSHRDFALFLKNFLIISSFFFVILFFAKILPKPTYQRSESHFFLRWSRRVSGAALLGLLSILFLEPTLLQSPRGQVSVAGFDFALANLLAYANEESMAEQNLTIVTAIIAGVFLLIQIVIFMFCYSRVSQIKNEELKAGLKLGLLDNEENLFDLGLYIGLGGTVLSLILLLVLDVKQDALIGAYTSTLFGILFVAALKITIIRPYRNHLLVKQAGEKRYES
jgi:preprotein translocase subunit SecG